MNIQSFNSEESKEFTGQGATKAPVSKKKPLIIASIIIAIALIVAVIMVWAPWSTNSADKIYNTVANNLSPYLPDYTEEEIEDVLSSELTDEQIEVFNEAMNNAGFIQGVEDIVSQDLETGVTVYTDKNGDIHTFIPDEEIGEAISGKTEEELEQMLDDHVQSILDGTSDEDQVDYIVDNDWYEPEEGWQEETGFDDTPGLVQGSPFLDEDDLGDPTKGNNDDSNVGGYYNPSTGEFYYELPEGAEVAD